jgi:nucleoside-diphosphate-sugar epimerase
MVTINQLVDLVADIAGKRIGKKHVPGPLGVRGRNSDNRLIREKLRWEPSQSLRNGLEPTYKWIERQVMRNIIPETRVGSDALNAAREVAAAFTHAG